ncbi:hypothetical protein [Lonepinella sp. BR2474]|uniref:hypothetical protein n=1 Tax=Lonepinella sp. BR2474 TaxID=3434548 RepID=UPI003F6DAF18
MNQIFARFQNVEGMNAKSNVIVSLLWLFFLTLTATITTAIWIENPLLLYSLIAFLTVEIVTIISVYIYFALKNPDCLRSETFTLNKMAIEKGHIGDNGVGMVENRPTPTETPVIIGGQNG